MKQFDVTIILITGYHWVEPTGYDLDQPILRRVEFTVDAETERQAIEIAMQKETSGHSIWESYASETEDSYTASLEHAQSINHQNS